MGANYVHDDPPPTEDETAMTSRVTLCLALSAALSASAVEAAAPDALTPLLNTIGERLAIANQVALSKWDSGKPVEDRQREREVIAAAVAQAPAYKLSGETVEAFFAAQIEANKLVQYIDLSDWTLEGKAPDLPRPDLAGQIRPQLDRLQKRLLQQLADFAPYRTDPQCPQWLARATHHNKQHPVQRLALIRATAQLCIAPKT
ncbi:chorismate mutase [Pseudomonas sp. NFACC09-4]|jgi:chorismate mutase|nr:chorismate mutase [Pseudomonas sp. NFACC09-4]SFX73706.1 chorismate mutase [Pseudomonas sp. NFACC36]SFX91082.1 chorismate mutase [Pseudomonas sp. NFACC49-2]SFX91308.1 chorismate mutase [Pseudomonas sp. NFACC43]SFX95051.1 chorismate mutase [Pseudomonas sp. NFACC47-1]SIS01370.1 chorismate mutase [Pseudomonas sp. 7SR1]